MEDIDKFIALFEDRIRAFGFKIADFGDLSLKFDALQKDLAKLYQTAQLHDEKFRFLSDFLQDHSDKERKQIDFAHYRLDQFVEVANQKISDLQSNQQNLPDLWQKIFNLSAFQSDLKQQSDALKSKVSSLTDLLQILKNESQEFLALHASLKQEISSISDNVKPLYIAISSEVNERQKLENWVVKLDQNLQVLCSSLEQMQLALSSRIDKEIKSLKSDVVGLIQKIDIPDVQNFIEKKDLDALQHSINLSLLDAKNALMKSQNNDMQLQIISKKLDAIQTQLKSLEISSQS